MKDSIFYRFGKLIYRLRWPIIGIWIILILACIPFISDITAPFKETGFSTQDSESEKTKEYLNKNLAFNDYNKILILYHSKTLQSSNPEYLQQIKNSLSRLKDFPLGTIIIYPNENKKQISKDKRSAYVAVFIKSHKKISDKQLDKFKSLIKKPPNLSLYIGGEAIFIEDVNQQTQTDLYKADFIATPVSLITLLFVFGSLVAALLPIFLGGASAIIILTLLYTLGHYFLLSVFTLNIALLLGLCLSLDYALFIISRFRDELAANNDTAQAIAVTQATAGKAILFSGLAVFASLSGLLLFPINILFSIAIGGLTAVFIAVFTAIILLPAILAVLSNKINFLPIRLFKSNNQRAKFWHWLAEKVVKRPLLYFFSILVVLLLLGYPFLASKFGVSDYHIFPEQSKPRAFYDIYAKKFNENELTPILVLLKTPKIFSQDNISKLYDFAHKIKDNQYVKNVNSIVTSDKNLTKSEYHSLYNDHKDLITEGLKKFLETSSRSYFTVMTVVSKYHQDSPQTKALVEHLDNMPLKKGMKIELSGIPVTNMELLDCISARLPYALLWILVFTYFILLFLLRSIFLPIKAILMNILSLTACYGALVLVFQDGYLHQLLNFDPQGIVDISLLVIIFCALFGFSMDYEVFLLTRIKESYELYGDNNKSIIFGIEKSSRIITSAALIVICICFSFLVADVLIVKAFGLGIAVAIFVDAFLVRTFLVPATMALLKKLNWYLPKWLDKILPKF